MTHRRRMSTIRIMAIITRTAFAEKATIAMLVELLKNCSIADGANGEVSALVPFVTGDDVTAMVCGLIVRFSVVISDDIFAFVGVINGISRVVIGASSALVVAADVTVVKDASVVVRETAVLVLANEEETASVFELQPTGRTAVPFSGAGPRLNTMAIKFYIFN